MKFDRTVTLSIIFALFIQTAGALLWAGASEARLAALEARVQSSAPNAERLARLEEQVLMARQSLLRIERRLESSPSPFVQP